MPLNKKTVVCPKCSKRFGTKQALHAHEQSVHTKAGRPKRSGPKAGSSGLRVMRAYGSDVAATVSINTNMALGTKIASFPISPIGFPDTRFAQEASLWSRWRPKKLVMHLTMSGASTTYGQLAIAWSADPTPDLLVGSGMQNVKRVMSYKPSRSVRLSEKVSLSIPVETSRKWLQTGGETDQSSQGAVVLVTTAVLGGFAGSMSGMVVLEWDVEFEGPEPVPLAASPVGTTIKPDAGWSNLFTTSDGSYDADVLTFKMHHGGDMCPWSSARLGIVYGPTLNTKITYKDSAGNSVVCKYFAKIATYTVPGLLLFASYADAREFIQTNSIAKALKYYSAGDECTPAVPELKPVVAATHEDNRIADLENTIELLNRRLAALEPTAPVNLMHDPIVSYHAKSMQDTLERVEHTQWQARNRGTSDEPLVLERGGSVTSPLYTFNENPLRRTSARTSISEPSVDDSFETIKQEDAPP